MALRDWSLLLMFTWYEATIYVQAKAGIRAG